MRCPAASRLDDYRERLEGRHRQRIDECRRELRRKRLGNHRVGAGLTPPTIATALEWLALRTRLALDQEVPVSSLEILVFARLASRPAHAQGRCGRVLAESQNQFLAVLREKARATTEVARLLPGGRYELDASADGIAIPGCSSKADRQTMIQRRDVVAQQPQLRPRPAVDDKIGVAVAVIVEDREGAPVVGEIQAAGC